MGDRTNLSALHSLKKKVAGIVPEKLMFQRRLRHELSNGEPELQILPAICDPTAISIDVGANCGIYAYLLAKHSLQVIAVEPQPRLAEYLRRVVPANVQVMSFAASAEAGQGEFYIPMMGDREIDSRASLLEGVNPGMAWRSIKVRKQRLDELLSAPGPVAVVKVDVEGNELAALSGAAAILESCHPTLIVESEHRHNAEAPANVFSFLSQFGYSGHFIHRSRLHPLSDFSLERFQNEDSAKVVFEDRSPEQVNNFVFTHPERRGVLDRIRQIFPDT